MLGRVRSYPQLAGAGQEEGQEVGQEVEQEVRGQERGQITPRLVRTGWWAGQQNGVFYSLEPGEEELLPATVQRQLSREQGRLEDRAGVDRQTSTATSGTTDQTKFLQKYFAK